MTAAIGGPKTDCVERDRSWRARAMKKSTRPAGETSEPCSHIPDTRYYKGVGGTMAIMGTFFLGPY